MANTGPSGAKGGARQAQLAQGGTEEVGCGSIPIGSVWFLPDERHCARFF